MQNPQITVPLLKEWKGEYHWMKPLKYKVKGAVTCQCI